MKTTFSKETISKHTKDNDLEILQSEQCSCLFCRHTMSAREVQDWVSDDFGMSAICPECGMDALIGDASGIVFTREELKEINEELFGDEYMESHPEAAKAFCDRYREGKITKKVTNELLYIQYLNLLSKQGDPYSTFELATLLEFGSEFTEADPKTAFSYYAAKSLERDGQAYTRMGVLCEKGSLGKIDYRGAYECYSKAMAFGSANGLLHFADCYAKGIYVEKNPDIASGILQNFYPDCYTRFVALVGNEPIIFASLCYRLGVMHQEGIGVERSDFIAMRFFLLARTAFSIQTEPINDEDIKKESFDCDARFASLSETLRYRKQKPTFDVDTFADSLALNSCANNGGFEGSSISEIRYDQDTKTLSFTTSFGHPQLIVDGPSLFCGFISTPIRWVFNDIVDVKLSNDKGLIRFNRCYGNADEGFKFCMYKNGVEEDVAEFTLSDPNEKNGVEEEDIPSRGEA